MNVYEHNKNKIITESYIKKLEDEKNLLEVSGDVKKYRKTLTLLNQTMKEVHESLDNHKQKAVLDPDMVQSDFSWVIGQLQEISEFLKGR